MEYCPTCRARVSGKSICHRCETDLQQILHLETQALHYQRLSTAALCAGQFEDAFTYALEACALYCSPDSIKALALASLACRRFPEAVRLYQKFTQLQKMES
jgi:tetratricopeptide (TPR) repeat protein